MVVMQNWIIKNNTKTDGQKLSVFNMLKTYKKYTNAVYVIKSKIDV